jgi:hypothetical protein
MSLPKALTLLEPNDSYGYAIQQLEAAATDQVRAMPYQLTQLLLGPADQDLWHDSGALESRGCDIAL